MSYALLMWYPAQIIPEVPVKGNVYSALRHLLYFLSPLYFPQVTRYPNLAGVNLSKLLFSFF